MFSLNSVTKKLSLQEKESNLPPSHLLGERPRCYHSASKTHVRGRICNLSPIHASVIFSFPEIFNIVLNMHYSFQHALKF